MGGKEFGRATRFYWDENDVELLGDNAPVTIGDFTHYKKQYRTTLGHLKAAVKEIEKAKE